MEEALQLYAEKVLDHHNPIMRYAGILNQKESEDMLAVIKNSKNNISKLQDDFELTPTI